MAIDVLDDLLTVGDVLAHAAVRHGDRIAVQDDAGELTFTELHVRARRLADGFMSAGLRPGDRVLEALPNGRDLLVSELALAVAGLVRVPLNPRLGPREWQGIREDSGARGLIVDERLAGAGGASIRQHVCCEITVGADDGGLADLIEAGSADAALPPAHEDDLVGLAYSSGTTGMPKGAMRTHRMRLASMRAMMREVLQPCGEIGAYLHAGPAIHTSGLFILPMLALGARQVMAQHPSPTQISSIIAANGITHLALVPSVIDALTRLPGPARHPFSALTMLAYAGAPMPATHIRRAADLLTDRLVQYYGLVEAIPPLTVLSIADHARGLSIEPRLLASAGRCVRDASITITGDAELGEVAVAGPMVTAGYWNASERNDLGKAFDGVALLTGDVGTIKDGYLFLTDRKNDMLVSGGYNVYPGEIEAVVVSSAGVREVVVVGLPDERWGQRIVLAYTTASGDDLDAAQHASLQHNLASLAPHKRPKSCHFVSTLPLGATGKIDRRAVAAQLSAAQHPLPDAPNERLPTS